MPTRKKKAKAKAKAPKYKKVTIGRFDSDLKEYAFDDGETVAQALDKAGITLATGESVNDLNGDERSLNDKVKPGQTLVVVGSFKSGK